MGGELWRRYLPGDVADELLVDGVVREAVRKVHGHLRVVGQHRQISAHASVRDGLLRAREILHDVPAAEELQWRIYNVYTYTRAIDI